MSDESVFSRLTKKQINSVLGRCGDCEEDLQATYSCPRCDGISEELGVMSINEFFKGEAYVVALLEVARAARDAYNGWLKSDDVVSPMRALTDALARLEKLRGGL